MGLQGQILKYHGKQVDEADYGGVATQKKV